jgi:hypothetical protein
VRAHSPERPPAGMVVKFMCAISAISAKSAISAISPLLTCRRADALPMVGAYAQKFQQANFGGAKRYLVYAWNRSHIWINLFRRAGRVGASVFYVVRLLTNGTISAYVVEVGERPVCHPACHLAWDGLRPASGGAVFPSCQNCSIRERTERPLLTL